MNNKMLPPDMIVDLFIETIRQTASIAKACSAAAIDRTMAYEMKRTDPEFALRWESAYEDGTDALEDEAVRRAMEGVEKNFYDKDGNVIRSETIYSDQLLLRLLETRRPAAWRARSTVEHTGTITLAAMVQRACELIEGTLEKAA